MVAQSQRIFKGRSIHIAEITSVADAIRAVNRRVARGESVYRWRGPRTPPLEPGDLIVPEETMPAQPGLAAEPVELSEPALRHLLPLKPGGVAFLWDKSFLWGYLAVSTLKDLGFCFDLLSAAAVRNGALDRYQLLVVPGGWANLKSEQLGCVGREKVRQYVDRGGCYLGLCGGVGLALQVDEGLGLLPATRKPMAERLPNFSGSIRVHRSSPHALWWGLQEEATFQVWWPSQFELLQPERIQVLGRYGRPESDFCVSDRNVQETRGEGLEWECLERAYEINLDPERLLNEPAIIEGAFGEGRVVLSYPHLETPDDAPGNLALFNIWYDLLHTSAGMYKPLPAGPVLPTPLHVDHESLDCVRTIAQEAEELIALGRRHRLWYWRNPWLLHWRRGIRGAEFCTVYILLSALARELEKARGRMDLPCTAFSPETRSQIRQLEYLWKRFRDQGRALLRSEERDLREKKDAGGPHFSSSVRALRTELFACVQCYGSKSYGGLYARLLDQIDTLLLQALLANLGSGTE